MGHFDVSSSSERKPFVELNLVAFIDLMSVCIIFLLITAVWTQVSMVQLGSSIYSKKTDEKPLTPPPFTEVVLRVDVLTKGFRLVVGKDQSLIPLVGNNYDKQTLISKLKKVKVKYPEKIDGVTSVRDEVLYKHLIEAMDALNVSGFPQVSITATGVL